MKLLRFDRLDYLLLRYVTVMLSNAMFCSSIEIGLKVHKRENFLGFDFETCTFS
jgi:hypothetical protein